MSDWFLLPSGRLCSDRLPREYRHAVCWRGGTHHLRREYWSIGRGLARRCWFRLFFESHLLLPSLPRRSLLLKRIRFTRLLFLHAFLRLLPPVEPRRAVLVIL